MYLYMNKNSKKVEIKYKDKIYSIDIESVEYVLSKLNCEKHKEDEITDLLEKYSLLDESFLENINYLKKEELFS